MAKYFNITAPQSLTVPQVTAGMGSVDPVTNVQTDEKKKKKKSRNEENMDNGADGNRYAESDAELFGGWG